MNRGIKYKISYNTIGDIETLHIYKIKFDDNPYFLPREFIALTEKESKRKMIEFLNNNNLLELGNH